MQKKYDLEYEPGKYRKRHFWERSQNHDLLCCCIAAVVFYSVIIISILVR